MKGLTYLSWDANDPWIEDTYYRIYQTIAYCNEFLRNATDNAISKFSDTDQTTIKQYRAETRFLRALAYYHAMDLYRNIPFVTEKDPVGAYTPPRYTSSQIFDYIESELKDIESTLPDRTAVTYGHAQRREQLLCDGWKFALHEQTGAERTDYNDSQWQSVSIPHDWAIYGPFSREYDLQSVAITQNGESKASLKTGRTGGLPYVGIGWYRRHLNIERFNASTNRAALLFDGAMSSLILGLSHIEIVILSNHHYCRNTFCNRFLCLFQRTPSINLS